MLCLVHQPTSDMLAKFRVTVLTIIKSHKDALVKQWEGDSHLLKTLFHTHTHPSLARYEELLAHMGERNPNIDLLALLKKCFELAAHDEMRGCINQILEQCRLLIRKTYTKSQAEELIASLKAVPRTKPFIASLESLINTKIKLDVIAGYCKIDRIHQSFLRIYDSIGITRDINNGSLYDDIAENFPVFVRHCIWKHLTELDKEKNDIPVVLIDRILHKIKPSDYPAVPADPQYSSNILDISHWQQNGCDVEAEFVRLWCRGFDGVVITTGKDVPRHPRGHNRLSLLLAICPLTTLRINYLGTQDPYTNLIWFLLTFSNNIQSLIVNEKNYSYVELCELIGDIPQENQLHVNSQLVQVRQSLQTVRADISSQAIHLDKVGLLLSSAKAILDSVKTLSKVAALKEQLAAIFLELSDYCVSNPAIAMQSQDAMRMIVEQSFSVYLNYRRHLPAENNEREKAYREKVKRLCHFCFSEPMQTIMLPIAERCLLDIANASKHYCSDTAMRVLGRFYLIPQPEETPEKRQLRHLAGVVYVSCLTPSNEQGDDTAQLLQTHYAGLMGVPVTSDKYNEKYPIKYLQALFLVYKAKKDRGHPLKEISMELLLQKERVMKRPGNFLITDLSKQSLADISPILLDISNIFNLPVVDKFIAAYKDIRTFDEYMNFQADMRAAFDNLRTMVNFDATNNEQENLFTYLLKMLPHHGPYREPCHIALSFVDMSIRNSDGQTRFAELFMKKQYRGIWIVLGETDEPNRSLNVNEKVNGQSLLQMVINELKTKGSFDIYEGYREKDSPPENTLLVIIRQLLGRGADPFAVTDEGLLEVRQLLDIYRKRAYDNVVSERDQLRKEISNLQAENARLTEKAEYTSGEVDISSEEETFRDAPRPRFFRGSF